MRELVVCAPQPRVLRHGRDEQPIGAQRTVHVRQDFFVFGDVLDDVERTDGIERVPVGQVTRIELYELDLREPTTRPHQTGGVLLAADQVEAALGMQSAQHESSAAADFEHARTSRLAQIFAEQRAR